MATSVIRWRIKGTFARLLNSMQEGEWKQSELMEMLKLSGQDSFEKRYFRPALKAGFIERTIPDKPSSHRQRYRLTEKGRSMAEWLRTQLEEDAVQRYPSVYWKSHSSRSSASPASVAGGGDDY